MKILFLAQGYPPTNWYYGVSTYTRELGRILSSRGHEVHVLDCMRTYRPQDELDGDIVVHRRPTFRVRGTRRIVRKLPVSVRRRINSYRPDRVLQRLNEALSFYVQARRLGVDFDVVQAPNGSLGLVFTLMRWRPIVVNLHCPPLFDPGNDHESRGWRAGLADALDRFTAVRADLLTSPSELMVRALKERRWVGRHEPWIIPNAMGLAPWSSVPSAGATRPVVLAVGKLRHIKAPEILVDAAALLKSEVDDVEVVFVGGSIGERDGRPYGDWVAERARALGAPCRFEERIPRAELTQYYADARVVAIPSRFDAFSYVGLEAMLSGRPVVCTTEVGLTELRADGNALSVVPPDDPKALADALMTYLKSPEAAVTAGERARALIAERHAPDRVAQEQEAAYQEAITRFQTRYGPSNPSKDGMPSGSTGEGSAALVELSAPVVEDHDG